MGWSVSKTLVRTGVPVAVLFVGKSVFDLSEHLSSVAAAETVSLNAMMFAILWLGVAVFMFILTRILPTPP